MVENRQWLWGHCMHFLHHLFSPLKIPVWNFLLPIAQELKISCQLGAHEGCELVGAIAGSIQNPEERKGTEENSTDNFHQGFKIALLKPLNFSYTGKK